MSTSKTFSINIVKFSELSVNDLYNILALRSEIFVIEQDCLYQDLDGKDKDCYELYCKNDETIFSTLRIIPSSITLDYPSIGRVCVKKEYRNKGYARKMMLEAIEFIKEKYDPLKIKLSGQAYLKDFYTSLGFEIVSDIYLEDGIKHYTFELNLK